MRHCCRPPSHSGVAPPQGRALLQKHSPISHQSPHSQETLVTRHHVQLLQPRSAHHAPPHTAACALLRCTAAPLPATGPQHSCTPLLHFLHHTVRGVRRNTFLGGWQPLCPPSPCQHCTPHSPSHITHAAHRFAPPRTTCLPPRAHWPLTSIHTSHFQTHVLAYAHTLLRSRCPKRHFRGNQLPGSSIGLSPLHPSQAVDLHVRPAQHLQSALAYLHAAQA
jgi:hypothetical protein